MRQIDSELELLNPGDHIDVTTSKGTLRCVFLPRSGYLDDESIVVKLPSGYNKAILKDDILSVVLAESPEKQEQKASEPIVQNTRLPRFSILHTGGTIASKVDYTTGGVIAQFTPHDLLELFPEIQSLAQIDSKLISNMLSEDMRFDHYNAIAHAIRQEIDNGAQGIIITHGTDTLHYTSAALSFMFKDSPVPIILVGAQRSSDRASSDAAQNLINAVYFLSQTTYYGVGVCMHENESDGSCLIHSGLHVRKMHTSRRDAFQSIDIAPLARVDYDTAKIEILNDSYLKSAPENPSVETTLFDTHLKIGMLYMHPHMSADEFKPYSSYDGLILIGTGLGHAPITATDELTNEHAHIAHALKELTKTTVVAMAPQTIYGRINMNVYSPGRTLQQIGILGQDTVLTPEVAYIKLAWLLSEYTDHAKVKEAYQKNLCGESPARLEWSGFFFASEE
jgi:glutamyl-tRNA(Gln) amidotransferase subunit D